MGLMLYLYYQSKINRQYRSWHQIRNAGESNRRLPALPSQVHQELSPPAWTELSE